MWLMICRRSLKNYQQRFDPLSPAPTAGGWELGPLGRAPAPTVQTSWERELTGIREVGIPVHIFATLPN